jgi:hypothetical protein
MRLPIYQIDAFTSRIFAGNPAAVVMPEALVSKHEVVLSQNFSGQARPDFLVDDVIEQLGIRSCRGDDSGNQNAGINDDPDHLAERLPVFFRSRLAAATAALI